MTNTTESRSERRESFAFRTSVTDAFENIPSARELRIIDDGGCEYRIKVTNGRLVVSAHDGIVLVAPYGSNRIEVRCEQG